MKKIFTIDDIMVAFVSALGYGFGYTITKLSGWHEIVCILICMVAGVSLEAVMGKIIFSKAVQKNKMSRVLIYAAIIIIILIAQYISVWWMGVSILDYVFEQVLWVVGMPVFGFALGIVIRGYRVWKIQKQYGDGSKGFVFDVDYKDMEDINKQNQLIHGKYDTELAVKTKTGIYVGDKEKKTISFFGIPYAKPPVGELRWKAPEPLDASESVFEAKHFGASAIQVEHKGSILKHHRQSEDCLYLNICVGTEKKEKNKPVLVLFHHGDFTFGGSTDPLMYGENFVTKHPDIVFVSFNYRLGIFGFIDFSDVPGGEAYPDTLNLGLLDQIAALRWIKDNISAFGGDPDRITAVGFEGGATSICLLAACEKAKGLFKRAFVFNGSLATIYDTPEGPSILAKELLKETASSSVEELMQLDMEVLKKAAQKLWHCACAPTGDGSLIPADIHEAYRNGAASGIDFIVGFPRKETQVIKSFIGEQNYEELLSATVVDLQDNMDPFLISRIQKYIADKTAVSSESEAKSMVVDQWIALCVYLDALTLSEGGNKVYMMLWDEKPVIENLGSGTVDVVTAILGNNEVSQMYGSVVNADLSVTIQSLMVKFMKGKALQLYPNEIKGVDEFDWKAFPKALIVEEGQFSCDTIAERLTEIEELFDFVVK